ncbi:MFS transporter [Bacillus pseudomycoides]|uniref:MFS transporter n=1 Tax=Bacillus pseudomycoides TaxID=64104 RepID=UPI000BED5287|nr:MFS transporter [Bacillus pseudomycoides]PEE03530.1 hypothetical protein CON86_24905 [Bacillus pseudomycoides]PEM71495.1 hypothetical protein CN632_23875 [Bacillus pseudomycoides]PHC79149.1 hypothetical protein COF63_27620 [Bacillus pseudomycoides]
MEFGYKNIFKDYNFILLFLGRFFIMSGSLFFSMELIWFTLSSTDNSAFKLSVITMGQTLPFILFGIYGGIKADQWNKKKIMIVSDLIKLPLILLIPFLAYRSTLSFGVLVVLSILVTVTLCFSEPAFRSIIPEVVKQDNVKSANALLDSIQRGTSIIIPLSLTFILKFLTEIDLFIVSAVCYLCGIFVHYFLRYKTIIHTEKKDKNESENKEFKNTMTYLNQNKHILFPIIGSAIAILINTGLWRVGLPIILKENFSSNINQFGIIIGILGAASLISSIVLGMLKYQSFTTFYLGIILWGVGLLTVGVFQNSIVFLYVASILIGIGQSMQGLTRILIIQENVPPDKLGKVFSTSSTLSYTSDSVSLAIISPILGVLTATIAFNLGGSILVVLAIIGYLKMRRPNITTYKETTIKENT